MLGPGDFFGEGALTGQSVRIGTATATIPTTVLIIDKGAMLRLLRDEPTFSERFISYMLTRNIRIEVDLVDHIFNSSEKRLARTLLLLARYGEQEGPNAGSQKISQETLAEIVGTTRSRVNFFMNKFRDLGFIEYNGDLKVDMSLLGVVLHGLVSPTRVGVGPAGPLANHVAQLICLLLKLAHPLRLHGEITTDFRDVAVDPLRQFGASQPAPVFRARRVGLREFGMASLLRRILPVRDARGRTVSNATIRRVRSAVSRRRPEVQCTSRPDASPPTTSFRRLCHTSQTPGDSGAVARQCEPCPGFAAGWRLRRARSSAPAHYTVSVPPEERILSPRAIPSVLPRRGGC